MSRRPPNPAAERAAQNQATIKSLLKLESNKVCADCKRNKHPRWASWNLGVFICIRCSGIHRGMGTHISRVKSVDLDSWTDEQLQSVLSWGNARANKYWEAKLAAGHAPSEARIENFIRTKYELKRWVMDGPIPDPSTLGDEADDDVPLSVVKEKHNVERRESLRKASMGSPPPSAKARPPPPADLIGGDDAPPRASTTGPTPGKAPPRADAGPPKASSTKDSLLGLDFLGPDTSAPPRPASTTGTPGTSGQSRPDLKQSILSLYAAAPRPQPQQQPSQTSSFGGMSSPGLQSSSNFGGGLNDAFSGLSFGGSSQTKPPQPKSPQVDAFSSLGNFGGSKPSPPPKNINAFANLSGGSFFDSKPAPAAHTHKSKQSAGGFGDFGGLVTPAAPTVPQTTPAPAPSSSGLGDLFDFSSSAPAPAPSRPTPPAPSTSTANSVFNLSASQAKSPPAAPVQNPITSAGQNWSNSDVWGNDAWATPDAAPKKSPEVSRSSAAATNDFGWGSAAAPSGGGGGLAGQSIVPGASGGFAPKVAADEEFGGWSSGGAPAASSGGTGTKPAAGLGGSGEDLFSNVWE